MAGVLNLRKRCVAFGVIKISLCLPGVAASRGNPGLSDTTPLELGQESNGHRNLLARTRLSPSVGQRSSSVLRFEEAIHRVTRAT